MPTMPRAAFIFDSGRASGGTGELRMDHCRISVTGLRTSHGPRVVFNRVPRVNALLLVAETFLASTVRVYCFPHPPT